MFRFDAAFRAEFRDNWRVLAIAFLTLLCGFSAPAFALPYIFPAVIDNLGWTREQAMLLASSKYAIGAICALLVGRFVDKTGAWLSLLFTVSLGGVALLSFLWIETLTAYYAIGIFLGFASGGTMVAVQVLISRAFHRSQATAMGMALMGNLAGSALIPFAIVAATDAFGWRGGIAAMSAGIWLAAVPLLLFGLVSPAMAFGRRPKTVPAAEAQAASDVSTADTMRHLMRQPRFWLIGIAVFLVSVVDQGFTQHQVLMFQDAGIDGYWQAAGMSAIGLFGIVTRLLVGNILDATSNKGLAILWWVLSASILMAFWLASPIIFIAYIITRAIGHSAVMLDAVTLAKHVWGPSRTLGTLLGTYTAMSSAGFALGPWLMGWLHDQSGSYASTYLIFAAVPIVASLLIWRIVPVFWLQLKAEKIVPRAEPAGATTASAAAT